MTEFQQLLDPHDRGVYEGSNSRLTDTIWPGRAGRETSSHPPLPSPCKSTPQLQLPLFVSIPWLFPFDGSDGSCHGPSTPTPPSWFIKSEITDDFPCQLPHKQVGLFSSLERVTDSHDNWVVGVSLGVSERRLYRSLRFSSPKGFRFLACA